MSDDDSFVILGSSPNSMQSLTLNGTDVSHIQNGGILQQESVQNTTKNVPSMTTSTASELKYSFIDDNSLAAGKSLAATAMRSVELPSMNGPSMISSGTLQSAQNSISMQQNSPKISLNGNGLNNNSLSGSMTSKPTAQQGSLAASFLMGDVQLDVLKASVYSQFPSLCGTDVNTEDIMKLQSFMSEYVELKDTLKKNNVAMRQHFVIIQKWQDEVKSYKEEQNKQKIEFQETIAKLNNDNRELKKELDLKIEQFKLNEKSMRKDNDDLIMKVSEQSAQIQNMTIQIQKLEQQNLASFEYIPNKEQNSQQVALKEQTDDEHEYVSILEHKRITKSFERQLSELTAKNLELEDMKQVYIDEINCLKVNLTSAEELLQKAQSDINILKSKDDEKTEHFINYQKERDEMKQTMELLKTQVEVYSKDFEIERNARQNLAGEKEQILTDLKLLQRRNQQLIEEQQARLSGSTLSGMQNTIETKNYTGTTPKGPSPPKAPVPSPRQQEEQVFTLSSFVCPLCNNSFRCLDLLQIHVQDCIDQ